MLSYWFWDGCFGKKTKRKGQNSSKFKMYWSVFLGHCFVYCLFTTTRLSNTTCISTSDVRLESEKNTVALHKSGSSVGTISRQFGVPRASVQTIIHNCNSDKDCLYKLYFFLLMPSMTYCADIWWNTYKKTKGLSGLWTKFDIVNLLIVLCQSTVLRFYDIVYLRALEMMYHIVNRNMPVVIHKTFKLREDKLQFQRTAYVFNKYGENKGEMQACQCWESNFGIDLRTNSNCVIKNFWIKLKIMNVLIRIKTCIPPSFFLCIFSSFKICGLSVT